MKKTIIIAGTVLTMTLSGLGYSATSVEASTTLSENKEKINKVEKEIINSSKKVNDLNLDIDVLENAISENEREAKKVTKEVDKLAKEIKKSEEEIAVLEDEIEQRNEILKERLSSYQTDGGEIGFMEVIFGSKGFEEFISRYTAVTAITTADNKLVETQKEAMAEVEEKQKEVENKLVETKERKKEIDEINQVKKDQKADLTESKKEAEKEVAALEDKKADYVAEGHNIAALEARVEAEIGTNNIAEPVVQTATQTNSNDAAESNNASESNDAAESNTSSQQESNAGAQRETAQAQQSNSEPAAQATNNPTPKKKKEKSTANLGGGSNGSAISAAQSVSGHPYVSAGKGPGGFDCSGLVAWAYGQEGVSLPSYTGALAGKGSKVPSLSQAKAGDLVFFRGGSHVGIYLGGGKFIGSQSSTGVAVADMNSGYWKNEFDGHIRRVK